MALAVCAVLAPRPAAANDPLNPSQGCSLFDPGPCTPSFCGVFSGSPCVPNNLPPIGQDLHLTIARAGTGDAPGPDGHVNTIRELFAALSACWLPPDGVPQGTQMSVRFSLKVSGDIIARPRITYTSKEVDDDARKIYRDAIFASLDRCMPLPLTKSFANAIAGRPIAIRFVAGKGD